MLLNEDSICEALALRGFKIMEPERFKVESLIAELSAAEFVVGVEGSNLIHGLFAMKAGASFVALQPPDRFSNPIKYYADALGLGYGFVIGYREQGGFRIKLDELLATFDLMQASTARQG